MVMVCVCVGGGGGGVSRFNSFFACQFENSYGPAVSRTLNLPFQEFLDPPLMYFKQVIQGQRSIFFFID